MKPRCAVILLLIGLLLPPALAAAQEPPAITLSAEAGFDGYYRVGQWLPVQVQLQNDGAAITGHVEVVLSDPDAGSVTYQYPVELPTQSRKEIAFNVLPHRYLNNLRLQLRDQDGQLVAQHDQPLKAIDTDDQLHGLIVDQPSAFNTLTEIDPPGGLAVTAQLTARQLPDRSAALDALDTLIISNVDTGALSDAQRTAVSAWVAQGGRLIVGGGASWQKTTAGLSELLPVQPDATITLNEVPALKTFADDPIDPGRLIVATGAATDDAQPVVAEAGTALITRRPRGFGEIYFLGFDPAALTEWDGLTGMYEQLLTAAVQQPNWSYGVQDWNSASTAAAMIPNLNLPPASLICGFVLLYMIAIGPVNYLIVRKLKRRELAWVTAPLISIGFLLAAFLTGSLMRGTDPAINRLALVEVWPTSDQARVTGIVGLYAPQRAAYSVSAADGFLLNPAYNDLPYGGNDTAAWTVLDGDGTQRAQVDMDVSEVKALSAQGAIAAPQIEVDTQIEVSASSARATGRVTNNSDLTLHDAVLLGPGASIELGTLQPGETAPVDLVLERAAAAEASDATPYYGNLDGTLEDIAGPYYYGQPDQQRARRYQLVSSLLGGYYSAPSRTRGDGLYLAGWSDRSPLPVSVDGQPFKAYDTTLYIIDLKPELRLTSGDSVALPPGMFQWTAETTGGPPIAPYDTDIYPGTHELVFKLRRPIAYDSVQELLLHLQGTGINQKNIDVALWNYQARNWTPLPDAQSGDISIADPAQHVGPGGEIKVQLQVDGNTYAHLDQLDFTLVAR
jgi:hypothetical protein